MVENWYKEMIFFHCGPWFPQELITASAICFEFWTYNHGQKSWDTFAFLGRFPIHTGPTPPLTPETVLHACIQNFCRVSTLYGVGGRENCKKILKSMHCFKREPITHQTCTEPLEKHLEKPPPPPRKLPRFFPPLLCNENFTYYALLTITQLFIPDTTFNWIVELLKTLQGSSFSQNQSQLYFPSSA